MNNKCRTTPKNTTCAPVKQEPQSVSCAPFTACLSFGRALHFNGNCFTVQGSHNITDGWYGEVQVINGCIVDARVTEIPVYTPAPCAPAAGPCGDDTGGGSTGCPPLSPDAKNLSYCTSGLLMTELVFGTLEGINKSGTGTRNDPLNLSVSGAGGGQTYITNGSPQVLTLTGSGGPTDAYIIGMQNSPLAAGTYGAFTTDPYGRVIGYDSTGDYGAIKSLLDGAGTTAVVGGGIGRIDITDTGVVSGSYVFGGYTATINSRGQTTAVQRNITLNPATYRLGGYDVTLTETGSVSAIVEAPVDPTGVPTTFVAQYEPDISSGDTIREMQIVTPVSGLLYVEYHGYMGTFTGSATRPGMSLDANGMSILIDGAALPNAMLTLSANPDGESYSRLARVGIRATTAVEVPAGPHMITIQGDLNLAAYAGFCKVDVVGRGS